MKKGDPKYYLFRFICIGLTTVLVGYILFRVITGRLGHREIWRITGIAISFLAFLCFSIRSFGLYKKAAREKRLVRLIPNTRTVMLATLLMTIACGMQAIAGWTGQSGERETWEIILNSIGLTIFLSLIISWVKQSYSHKKAAKKATG